MKTRNKLFRLGAYCLVLLMITALLFVGGSFSKITSEGSTTEFPPLTVANFGVDVVEEPLYNEVDRYSTYDGLSNHQLLVCKFTIANNSDVDIIIDDLIFQTNYEEDRTVGGVGDVTFHLCVDDDPDKLYQLNVKDDKEGHNLSCSLGNKIYLEKSDTIECAIVVDCNGEKYPIGLKFTSGDEPLIITATQAEKEMS